MQCDQCKSSIETILSVNREKKKTKPCLKLIYLYLGFEGQSFVSPETEFLQCLQQKQ